MPRRARGAGQLAPRVSRYVRRTRTSLGRAIRIAYRAVHHTGSGWSGWRGLTLTLTLTPTLTLTSYWMIMLEWSAFYAGMAGLLPMALIGVPLSRTSALWRALGRSYEEAIAFHRALGHLMMAACASMSHTSRLLSASVSVGLCGQLALRLPRASASLDQSAAWATH